MIWFQIERFVVFVILAVVRTVLIDIIGWRILVAILKDKKWLENILKPIKLNVYAFVHIITFVFSNLGSYYANRYITFQNQSQGTEQQLILNFLLVSGVSLIISVVLINWLTSSIKVLNLVSKNNLLNKHWLIVAKILTVGVTMITNYIGYAFLVF